MYESTNIRDETSSNNNDDDDDDNGGDDSSAVDQPARAVGICHIQLQIATVSSVTASGAHECFKLTRDVPFNDEAKVVAVADADAGATAEEGRSPDLGRC